MDSSDLVRQITQKVLERLGSGQSEPARQDATRPAVPAAGRNILILLTGGDAGLDEALVQTGRLAEKAASATVVLSPSAQRLVGMPAVRRAAPEATILTDGDVWQLLEGTQAIFLPNMSLNAASKIAGLQPDSLVCILAVYGLLKGIPVTASRDSVWPAATNPELAPEGVRRAVERLLARLEELGISLVPVERLAGDASHPAAGATGERATSSGSCSKSSGGECSDCGRCVSDNPGEVQRLVEQGADRIGSTLGAKPAADPLNKLIDHTLLKPDATEEQIRKLCEEAKQFGFASVCVNPAWVPLAAELLRGTDVKVCTVIGFPLGATTPTTKAIETRDAIANGAQEIDMVINVGALKSGDDELVLRDIRSVVEAARGRAIVKVILETALLTKEEIVKACLLAKQAGADFVKTSTGFGGGGATVEDVALMRATVGPEMGVKASGGIKDRKTAEAMVAAGATRIGASASVAIATGKGASAGGY